MLYEVITEPIELTVQRARPFTRTSPDPMIVALTSPSDVNAVSPDPAMVTVAVADIRPNARERNNFV